jgi:hypothetical protein
MAKRRNIEWTDKLDPEPETVRIMLMKDVLLNYTGLATGKLYIFNRGGSILDVDKKDAEIMLKRIEQRSCCGSISSPYFEIVR